MRNVLIAYKYLPHYRKAFFERLRARLLADDIALNLVFGNPDPHDLLKKDAVSLPWAVYRPNTIIKVGGRYLVYQHLIDLAISADLVIVEQASRLLVNPVLLILQYFGGPRVALWGHGKNFQTPEGPITKFVKQVQTRRGTWWFAYNELSAQVMMSFGIPSERITRVMNTIDTSTLEIDLANTTEEDVQTFKRGIGVHTNNIALYMGGMYPEKRIPFLLEAATLIRKKIPDFHLLVVGSGIDERFMHDFAARHFWCKALGPSFGREKAMALRSAKVLLIPGLVGLAIVDSFVARVPIITTAITQHSPEIEYLQNGINGVMAENSTDAQAYANAVAGTMGDSSYLESLRQGCAKSASLLTMDAMVENFASGIREALR